jgi:hypothetical protein
VKILTDTIFKICATMMDRFGAVILVIFLRSALGLVSLFRLYTSYTLVDSSPLLSTGARSEIHTWSTNGVF